MNLRLASIIALSCTVACSSESSTTSGELGAVSFAFDCGLDCRAPMDHAVLVGHTAAVIIEGGADADVDELTVDTLDHGIAWCGDVQRQDNRMRVQCAGLTPGRTRLLVVLDGLPAADGPVLPDDEFDELGDLPPETVDTIDLVVAGVTGLVTTLDWVAPAQGPTVPVAEEPLRLRAGQRVRIGVIPTDGSGRELMAVGGRSTCALSAASIAVTSPPCSVASDEFEVLAVQPGSVDVTFDTGGALQRFEIEVVR